MIQTERFQLRVRGEPIGTAYGVENWFRAVGFICDNLGRVATTPRWAVEFEMARQNFLDAYAQRPDLFDAIPSVKRLRDKLEVPIASIARGPSGFGDDPED